ncbi:Ig-like domain-containing protein [Kangiella koreensis]|uniref:Cadherin domain-containing protein n=1 Tax=Kangiella koreensis (strain DSM 16069 / JCM 12317 / KCTC 12182 / SW-125) TaxID=523791 RepID=C7R713_KANKD|nr:Ig-like domain-containing protein [Kangiella koreensis]ACV27469.1 putative unknown lipoprotein [Kangiella koreensis DSM 16069]
MNIAKYMQPIPLLSVLLLSALILGGCDNDGPNRSEPPVNTKPEAIAQSVMTETDTTVNGQLEGSDADGDSLTFSLSQDVMYGVLTVNSDGSFSYTPDNGFTGTDQFSFVVSDGSATSDPAIVDITINVKQEMFGSYSRASYSKSETDEPSGVNGREFIFDVDSTDYYQDLIIEGEQ